MTYEDIDVSHISYLALFDSADDSLLDTFLNPVEVNEKYFKTFNDLKESQCKNVDFIIHEQIDNEVCRIAVKSLDKIYLEVYSVDEFETKFAELFD